jgi:uncharacterized cupredoxin-like copper-binding protein
MKKIKVVTLGLALCAVLAMAVPAFAHQTGTSVTVTAGKPSEFSFTLSTKTVKHGAVTFKVKNGGSISHDFKIDGKQTKLLSPGQSATLSVTFARAGSYPYECTVPGHAAAGMKGVLKVT